MTDEIARRINICLGIVLFLDAVFALTVLWYWAFNDISNKLLVACAVTGVAFAILSIWGLAWVYDERES